MSVKFQESLMFDCIGNTVTVEAYRCILMWFALWTPPNSWGEHDPGWWGIVCCVWVVWKWWFPKHPRCYLAVQQDCKCVPNTMITTSLVIVIETWLYTVHSCVYMSVRVWTFCTSDVFIAVELLMQADMVNPLKLAFQSASPRPHFSHRGMLQHKICWLLQMIVQRTREYRPSSVLCMSDFPTDAMKLH